MAKQTAGQNKSARPAPTKSAPPVQPLRHEPWQDQQPPAQVFPPDGKVQTWRAKVDCTYDGRLVNAGEIIHAADLKNEHFEAVQG